MTATDAPRVHPTALVEADVVLGARTAVWDGVHLRGPSTIGCDCIIGEKTYVAYGVAIGDCVKINAHVYVCTGVVIESGAMIAAGVIFTNDRYPRACDEDGALRTSDPTADTLHTTVRRCATIGAGAIVGAGLDVGAWAMVGMGAVVTHDVPTHALVMGNPARVRGWVCACGQPIAHGVARPPRRTRCGICGRPWMAETPASVHQLPLRVPA